AEAEVRAGDDHLAPDRPQDPLGERLRRKLGELEIEVHDERLLDAGLPEQLQPPFEWDEQLDAVAERDPRVRVEGDRGRRGPRRTRGVENAPMADVDAVERPERDRPRLRLDLLHAPGDDHSRASASSAVSSRSGSASSTSNGPTSVRRSVAQWPPSAVAIGDELELVDARAADRHLDRHAFAVELVGALAADLDCRGGRDGQLDLAAERLETTLQLVIGRRLGAADDRPLTVPRVHGRAQVYVREVALV